MFVLVMLRVFFPLPYAKASVLVLADGRNPSYPGICPVCCEVPSFKSSGITGALVKVLLSRVYGLYPMSPNFILYSVWPILLFEI